MAYNTTNLKQVLKKNEEWLAREYSQVHTGRATPIVLDSILVVNYDGRVPIKNIASITVEDPRNLRIAPWDKNQIKDIETAIMTANLGLSVSSDGAGVRVTFPMLTTESRTKLAKVLKEKLEEARIKVRQERNDEIHKLSDLSEDEQKRAKNEIQKCVDEANENLEVIFSKKEKDVMN